MVAAAGTVRMPGMKLFVHVILTFCCSKLVGDSRVDT
jgi:hypothetical protein